MVHLEPKQYNIIKDILIKFTRQFNNLPANDIAFLKMQKEILFKYPEMGSQVNQFFFQVAYRYRHFQDTDIMSVFNNTFKIVDKYNLNGGLSDASTINTVASVYSLCKNTAIGGKNIEVHSTPIPYTSPQYKWSKEIPSIKKKREEAIAATGQPNNDLTIEGIYYDFKFGHIYTTKNIIMPLSWEEGLEKGDNFLRGLFIGIRNQSDFGKKKFLLASLHSIINNRKLTIHEKLDAWISVHAEHMSNIPKDIRIPIAYVYNNREYKFMTFKEERETVRVSSDVIENPKSAHKAIIGLLDGKSDIIKKNAAIMTEKGLDFSWDNESLTVD